MRKGLPVILIFTVFVLHSYAQTNEFTYQGKLNHNGGPANGAYDFEFRLFPPFGGTTQIGPNPEEHAGPRAAAKQAGSTSASPDDSDKAPPKAPPKA